MRSIMVLLVVAGCTGKPGADDIAKQLTALADEACACVDLACADAMDKKIRAAAQANKDTVYTREEQAELLAKIEPITKRIDRCLVKANPKLRPYLTLADAICTVEHKDQAMQFVAELLKWRRENEISLLAGPDQNVVRREHDRVDECLRKLGVELPKT